MWYRDMQWAKLLEKWHQQICLTHSCHKPSICKKTNKQTKKQQQKQKQKTTGSVKRSKTRSVWIEPFAFTLLGNRITSYFLKFNQPCISGTNPTWSWFHLLWLYFFCQSDSLFVLTHFMLPLFPTSEYFFPSSSESIGISVLFLSWFYPPTHPLASGPKVTQSVFLFTSWIL